MGVRFFLAARNINIATITDDYGTMRRILTTWQFSWPIYIAVVFPWTHKAAAVVPGLESFASSKQAYPTSVLEASEQKATKN